MFDLAEELARRGHSVMVLTADRSYEDASIRYRSQEVTAAGVIVRRLPHTSFGKASVIKRTVGILSYFLQATVVACTLSRVEVIVYSTSPPFVGLAAVLASLVRSFPTVFWAMDLNPDQLIALGKITPHGAPARLMRRINRFTSKHASEVIALDEMMAERLLTCGARRDATHIIPPWTATDTQARPPQRDANPFRAEHGLNGSIVVMYSGNHTRSNPLTTLLAAAVELRDLPNLRFVFVGDGLAKRDVTECISQHELSNVLSLPYQAKEILAISLGAADVHVVSLGDRMAGVIHPCKVYGAMAVGRPILYLGPPQSHVARILSTYKNGWSIRHGDVAATVACLREIASLSYDDLDSIGARGASAMKINFNRSLLCASVASAVEAAISPKPD